MYGWTLYTEVLYAGSCDDVMDDVERFGSLEVSDALTLARIVIHIKPAHRTTAQQHIQGMVERVGVTETRRQEGLRGLTTCIMENAPQKIEKKPNRAYMAILGSK